MESHENHDRRRGQHLTVLRSACTVYICFDCREQGLTQEDISGWPEFSNADYERHSHWADAEWHRLTHKETE